MKKKLLALIVLLVSCLSMISASEMCVRKKNGEIVRFNVEDVEEVFYNLTGNPEDSTAVDASDVPLKFNVLLGNTVEVTKDFSYCDLESVSIPAKVRIDGSVYNVVAISSWAFSGFPSLTKIEIPSSVVVIGESAFKDCENLDVVVDNSKLNIKIGENAFSGCKSVKYTK